MKVEISITLMPTYFSHYSPTTQTYFVFSAVILIWIQIRDACSPPEMGKLKFDQLESQDFWFKWTQDWSTTKSTLELKNVRFLLEGWSKTIVIQYYRSQVGQLDALRKLRSVCRRQISLYYSCSLTTGI